MIDITDRWIVPTHLIEALAREAASPAPKAVSADSSERRQPATGYTSRLLVDRWLDERGVNYRVKPEPDGLGRTVYLLAHCPFDESHAGKDACVMQAPDGKLSAKCFHNSCQANGWKQFKETIGPPERHHYDPPLEKRSRRRPDPPDHPAPPGDHPTAAANPPLRMVRINPVSLHVRETMRDITDVFRDAGQYYRRADQLVRVAGARITPILKAAELAGHLNQFAEVVVAGDDGVEYKPLPTAYANTWLNNQGELDRLSPINMYTHNPVYTLDWRPTPPGYDPATGIYYAGDPVPPRDGTTHLDVLLRDFCFRTPGDRTNYLGVLLTIVLMSHFIGSKPAVLFNGNQPNLGKSMLAQILAVLRDGHKTATVTYNPNDEEFEKRLGARVKHGATTLIIDNAKSRGRTNTRIESACLERSITDPILSFRLVGYSEEIRAENSHLFCITANTPELSHDLVSRCLMVELYHEGDPRRRAFSIADPEAYAEENRTELLGELLGLVERWRAAGAPRAEAKSRFNKKGWGPIVGGILEVAGYAGFLANAERAADELDPTRLAFGALVATLAEAEQDKWTSGDLAAFARRQKFFELVPADMAERAAATRLGMMAARYLDVPFPLPERGVARLRRTFDRNGNLYHVEVELASTV